VAGAELAIMAAQFYGSITDSVGYEFDDGIDFNPEGKQFQVYSQQEYQSAMLICQEISKEIKYKVKQLRTEVLAL